LILTASVIAKKRNYGDEGKRFNLRVLFIAIWEAKWALGTPAIIFGGIYGGIFTPTEAAAVAVFYAAFSGLFLYKKLTLKDIYMSLRVTALMAGLLLLLTPTIAFGQLVAFLNLPKEVQYFFSAITQSPFVVMLLIGALYIFLGTFMESLAQIIIFTPVLLPVTKSLGIDPVLFGVFTVATCEIGFLTPPVGANLNVASRLTTATFEEISVSVVPFLLAYILVMYLIVLFPNISLYIPNLFFGLR
jgi:C4-dicarboxylate transporter DctM subunit